MSVIPAVGYLLAHSPMYTEHLVLTASRQGAGIHRKVQACVTRPTPAAEPSLDFSVCLGAALELGV